MNRPLPSAGIPEFTVRSVGLGIVLALVMCAANVYLGLYAGMTVSASIPAAVISMGILRGLMRRGTILENNMVQTIASSGESLAAGAIFTIPALVITGVWKEFNYWETTLIAGAGGVLGVLFMVPLRRPIIVDESELTFPEGVACAEVLKAGDTGGKKVKYVFLSLAAGAAFKFCVAGVTLVRGTLEGAWRAGGRVFYFGSDISPALLGVGYIVGFNVAALMFLGGCAGWLAAIPLMSGGAGGAALDSAWTLWSKEVRYIGVGAMAVGGMWSIVNIMKSVSGRMKETFTAMKNGGGASVETTRKDMDLSPRTLVVLLIITIAVIFAFASKITGGLVSGAVAAVIMAVASFVFVAVSAYLVGLVGSSNNPVSGMTICAVLFAGLVLLVTGATGREGMLATLCIAGVVCCAVCSAGDISQDLKTGRLVGATPYLQQWGEIIGAIAPAFIIAPVMVVLHTSYGIGTEAPGALKAPQATLFAGLTRSMFGEAPLPWNMVAIGAAVAVFLIIADSALKKRNSAFRLYVMPVAVGIYLPLSLAVPVFAGGVIQLLTSKSANAGKGVLCASGLIAGEAITGILIGAVIYFNRNLLPINISAPALVTLLAAAVAVFALWRVSSGKTNK